MAVLDTLQGRERGDDRLAAADIALQKPLHGVRLREVAADLRQRLVLGPGELERQPRQQRLRQLAARLERGRSNRPAAEAVHSHRQLLREELVELDAAPGGMAALDEIGLRNLLRRPVQQQDRVAKRRKLEAP